MRRSSLVPLLLAACASKDPTATSPGDTAVSARYTDRAGKVSSYDDVEVMSGRVVTVEGRFDHIRGQHGMVILDSDLRIYVPHFDLFKRNDDWLKYVGQRVQVTGRLHSYTKNIPGYHGPSLEIMHFTGPVR